MSKIPGRLARLVVPALVLASSVVYSAFAADSTGAITRQYWLGISGEGVAALTSHPNYPDSPGGSEALTIFEGPLNWADNYGSRIHGYVHPPVSGRYIFWIASDNDSELWLSTDENPANRVRIAFVNGWTKYRDWNKFASQRSSPITLTAGRRYYIEALHKEGDIGDSVAVGWQLPDGALERPIPGDRLSPAP